MEPLSTNRLLDERQLRNTVGERISLEQAKAWTATYQAHHAGGLKSVFFSADVFQKLFLQDGATGIRIYNATDADGQDCFVLVGATEGGDLTEDNNIAFDKGQGCPDVCVISPLNHS